MGLGTEGRNHKRPKILKDRILKNPIFGARYGRLKSQKAENLKRPNIKNPIFGIRYGGPKSQKAETIRSKISKVRILKNMIFGARYGRPKPQGRKFQKAEY